MLLSTLMKLLRRRPKSVNIDLIELSKYTVDLQEVTKLRNNTTDQDELERYNKLIEVMQKVMIRLNEGGLK